MCIRFMNFAKFTIKFMSISSERTLNQKSLLSGGLLLERLLNMTFQFLYIQPNLQGKIFKKRKLLQQQLPIITNTIKIPRHFFQHIYLLLWREHNQPKAQKIIMYLPFHHSITVVLEWIFSEEGTRKRKNAKKGFKMKNFITIK